MQHAAPHACLHVTAHTPARLTVPPAPPPVRSEIQGVAAAQAGASVLQPNVGRVRDWYARHPGAIRDPHGPREDSGYTSRSDPGRALVQQLYNYVAKHHGGRTKIMASGLRSVEGGWRAVVGVGGGVMAWLGVIRVSSAAAWWAARLCSGNAGLLG
jgi:hypothetical protein